MTVITFLLSWAILHYFVLLLCLVSSILSLAGCVQPMHLHYRPNDQIIETLGIDMARARLRETLLRAVRPQIQTMTLTDTSIQWQPGGVQIYFVNLSSIDVFDNHTVFIRGAGDQVLSTIVYGTDQDAKLFADLLVGFRKNFKERVEDTLEFKQAHYQCLKESETQYMGAGWGIFLAKAQAEKTQKEKYTSCMAAHGY